MTKQDICRGLQKYNNQAGVINKNQISRFLGEKKPGRRTKRITENLMAVDGKWFLITDVAGEILRQVE